MGIGLSWTEVESTVFAPNVISLAYAAPWEAVGASGSGPCGIGVPGFTFGLPWGSTEDIDMVDFMADPLITGWDFLVIHFSAIGGANLAWDCPCGGSCRFSDNSIEGTWYDGGGSIEQDFQGSPAVFHDFVLGGGFWLGSGNPASPEFFDPISFPPPLGSHFVITNGGNHIRLIFQVYVVVYFPGPIPPPPPPPPPWPPPPPSNPPACGTFIPS